MRKIIPLFLAFTFIFSGVAYADQAIDAAGAATLEKQVNDDLQWRTNMTKILGGGVFTDGKAAVTLKKKFYEVNLPHLAVFTKQGKLDIGAVVLNVAPAPERGAWLIQQVTLPPSMTFYDAKGAVMAQVSIGSQRLTATWLPAQSIYPKIDSLLQDIKITITGGNAATARIATLKSLVTLKYNGDGTWSGPADFDATGLTLDIAGQNPLAISIGKVSSRNVYDRLDMTQSLKIKEAAEKSLKNGGPQTDEEKKALLAKLEVPASADGTLSTLDISKFLLHDTGSQQQSQREISLNQFTFSGLTTGLKQEKSKILLKTAFDGLHVSFVPASFVDLVPHTLNAEIAIDNLPISKVTGPLFTIATKQPAANGQGATAADKQAQDEAKADISAAEDLLSKTLKHAGTSLTLQDTFMVSNALSTRLQGNIDASADAALGATVKMVLAFKGLDEVVQKIQAQALKPGADPHMLGLLMGLMTLQTRGTPDKAADGISVRNFILEMHKDGNILLNGALLNPKAAPAAQQP